MKISEVRKFLESYRVGLPLALLIFMASCAQVDSIGPEVDRDFTKALSSDGYSDIDVFKGVIFLDGPVSQHLNDFSDLNVVNMLEDPAQIEEIRNMHDEIASILLANNENYMADFRQRITSGEYYLVQSTLKSTADDVINAMSILSGQSVPELTAQASEAMAVLESEYDLNNNDNQSQIAIKIKVAAEAESEPTVAVYKWVVVAVALAVVVVAVLVLFIGLSMEDPDGNPYLMEDYLANVTLELQGI